MFHWIQEIFPGHRHKWKIIGTTAVHYDIIRTFPDHYETTLQCEICGNIKRRKC